MLRHLCLITMIVGAQGTCTNFSSEPQTIATPVILGIVSEDDGYVLEIAAQNLELGFLGYRLFQGSSEDNVQTQNPAAGTDCTLLNELPNQGVVYEIEVKGESTLTDTGSTRICAIPTSLQTGQYVALRALLFNVTTIETSSSSNAVLVP